MKKNILLLFVIGLLAGNIYAQKMKFIAGADGNYFIPIGTLGDRFEPTIGTSVYFGQEVSKSWAWTGRFEYFKFGKENAEKLHLIKNVAVGAETELFDIPLTGLDMSLEIIGLSANAFYHVINTGDFKADISFGFGFYKWQAPREKYTLFIDQNTKTFYTDTVGVNGSFNKVVDVPSISQNDWSGGFNLGLVFDYTVYDKVSVYAGAEYKAVLGEIWQALALNLENIAGFQMINLRAGAKVNF